MLKKIIAVEGLFPGQRTEGVPMTAVTSFVRPTVNGRTSSAESFRSPQKSPEELAAAQEASPTIRRKRSARANSPVYQPLTHSGCSGSSLHQEVYPSGVNLITKKTNSQGEFEIYEKIYKATLAANPDNPSLRRPFVAVPIDEPINDEICLPKFPKVLSDIDFSQIPTKSKLSVWVTLMHQIIEGTDYLHNTIGVIHRDLKPDNIGIDHAAGVVRIFDFDCSEALGAKVSPKGATYYKPPALQTCPSYVCSAYEDIFAIARMMKDIAEAMGIYRSADVSSTLASMLASEASSIQDVKVSLENAFDLNRLAIEAQEFWATQKLSQSKKQKAMQQQDEFLLRSRQDGCDSDSTAAIAAALGVKPAETWSLRGVPANVGNTFASLQNQGASDGPKARGKENEGLFSLSKREVGGGATEKKTSFAQRS
jgi:hypothetical protein